MRIVLEDVELQTTEYAEGTDISFTCFTRGGAGFEELSETLAAEDRVLLLRRGEDDISVRVLEHEVWPPYSRRLGDGLHRHEVQLQIVGAAALTPIIAPRQAAANADLLAAR